MKRLRAILILLYMPIAMLTMIVAMLCLSFTYPWDKYSPLNEIFNDFKYANSLEFYKELFTMLIFNKDYKS